ncbi:hypothetical protein B0H63DRAFT_122009 [Podospora didyma]|uniref:Uncharacterized protein n=1 Tax=Podospora didyma TaxID=330526 RepID=A0AAE0NZT5_9PEZI|nr:hypothetical protein B0H63DRAFT_122009 [Podospora didyma]
MAYKESKAFLKERLAAGVFGKLGNGLEGDLNKYLRIFLGSLLDSLMTKELPAPEGITAVTTPWLAKCHHMTHNFDHISRSTSTEMFIKLMEWHSKLQEKDHDGLSSAVASTITACTWQCHSFPPYHGFPGNEAGKIIPYWIHNIRKRWKEVTKRHKDLSEYVGDYFNVERTLEERVYGKSADDAGAPRKRIFDEFFYYGAEMSSLRFSTEKVPWPPSMRIIEQYSSILPDTIYPSDRQLGS